jgi:hypothetical protein
VVYYLKYRYRNTFLDFVCPFVVYEKSRSGKSLGATKVQEYNPIANHCDSPKIAIFHRPTVGLAAL